MTSLTSINADNTFQLIEEHMDVFHTNNTLKSEKVSSITECVLMCTTDDRKCDGIVLCKDAGEHHSFICKTIRFLEVDTRLKSSQFCSFYELSFIGK